MGKSRAAKRQCTVDPVNIIKAQDLNNDGTVTRREEKISKKLTKKGLKVKNIKSSKLDKNNDGRVSRSEAAGKKAKALRKTPSKPTRSSKRLAALARRKK
uniref:EF-hand domain-containing protein n=1 Tax=Lotharella oceanica TaxID=641309 RepID=A0A7S2TTR8_9EUKA|mmetsp:Transcript_2788/g.5309  ORF Transcript_2788/g.5309 Transcript_2788/m.5309 type:complete len:100 (+) Transcript_2788:90-389(+)|eukprot:CAMPEP_0170169130 /NCGR_PEP_ID=MMETSP0040_2-20121228/2070_1 /TAXON_ID=641309 /ORGANISM="Lotharella oceanica, Strain CCMP622" /LENGTH=99 /DNA_ID=CAMNT_0010407709 /DNA_START=68 /DNA_END=367 /DNA_ORIENTATION=-